MTTAVIAYDRDLPEIPDRRPWEKPASHLVKDGDAPGGWRVAGGRRESRILLVPAVRAAVDAWRDGGYPGASDVTRRLFEYWFEEDHDVPGFGAPFRYYFCQREAIETLAWLVEVGGEPDVQKLIMSHAKFFDRDLFTRNISFQTTMDGRRQVRRYVEELKAEGVQDLPPEGLARLAFKMATGAGKTWVMAMAVIWAGFHKQRVSGSRLSRNFLVVAPNVIVYQRLERDFAANRVFRQLPLIPPEWRSGFSQKVILRGDSAEPVAGGNLFLTNIQQLYGSRDREWAPGNAVDAQLGRKPAGSLATSGQRSMLERVKSLDDLVVLNDEAHHVHEEDLEWTRSLLGVHGTLSHGLSLWLDFSATPKDQRGMYFPWTVCDYPLAQAVEDRIVKSPIIVTREDDAGRPSEDPDHVTRETVVEKCSYWIRAAVARWKAHHEVYGRLGVRPVLFIMAEKNAYADVIGEHLWRSGEFGFRKSEVLVIHTDSTGEVTKRDLEQARTAARDVDRADSRIKAIVSVMMLREGWDVRNVSVVLGLRPFTARAEVLPEQVIGRGLRLMAGIGPDRTQTLEVLGTRNLLDVLRGQLEAEGVGVATARTDPVLPVTVKPIRERGEYDMEFPVTKPSLKRDVRRLSGLRLGDLAAIYEQEELAEPVRVRLTLEFATTETEVHQADVAAVEPPPARVVLAGIAGRVGERTGLSGGFATLYPIVRNYAAKRCFGRSVDLDDRTVRSHLARPELQEGISKYLARKVGELTVERRSIEFAGEGFRLSQTRPFSWRRNLPLFEARKTVFNYVATYNDFERRFAEFLDQADDVTRFAALATTEQGSSATPFRVDYLKPSGAIGFYYPDWIVMQNFRGMETRWIIETKGRVWEGTAEKDAAAREWCRRVGRATGRTWRYTRVNQSEFSGRDSTLRAFIVRRANAAAAESQSNMEPVTQAEIRQWKQEGRP